MNVRKFEELCELAKRKCRITWCDEYTEQRIHDIVENAVASLKRKLGMSDQEEEDFLSPGTTRILFENYCMYDWNDMLEDFSKNYKEEILSERHKYEVKHAKKEDAKL